jgi:hypothetical protein
MIYKVVRDSDDIMYYALLGTVITSAKFLDAFFFHFDNIFVLDKDSKNAFFSSIVLFP